MIMRLIHGAIEARRRLPELFSEAVLEQYQDEEQTVREIIGDVRVRGDEAVLEYERRFACESLTAARFLVSSQEIDRAIDQVPPRFVEALERAAANIRRFHERQLRQSWMDLTEPGKFVGQRFTPIAKVGMCVPGQKAPCPSTVLMLGVPARVAGVEQLTMITPPQPDGSVDPGILVAARIAGIDEVYRVSGAQGVAALAFGTESVPRVEKVVGPGNIYVTLAKRLLFGVVGIESLPGPSEVMVLADETANPAYAAAELLAQAEHGADSSAILVTNSATVAEAVLAEVERQLSDLPRREYAARSLAENGVAVVTRTLAEAFTLVNERAPEHVVLLIDHALEALPSVRNAGAVFIGPWSPVPLGDYYAGPSHVLPTATTARFLSGVGVDDFMKRTSVVCYSREALSAAAEDLVTLAEAEGFAAHANAVRLRQHPAAHASEDAP